MERAEDDQGDIVATRVFEGLSDDALIIRASYLDVATEREGFCDAAKI